MTSQKDLQSLIAGIDSILAKAGSRLLWSKPSDVARERQVLEQVRRYLVSVQQNSVATPNLPSASTLPTQQSIVQQIVQAVTQEMDVLRTDLREPWQAELAALRQQRESLVQEIQQLETRKQQLLDTLTQQETVQEQRISEFAQELISRSTERVTQQLTETLVNLEAQLLNAQSPSGGKPDHNSTVMSPQARLEQLRQLQVESDRMLTTLDANQRAIFETLQRNLYGYQDSLSQGLDKMHRLGLQGEMLFTALVNRLAQQLGREASTLLQSSSQFAEVVHQPYKTTNQTPPEIQLSVQGWQETEPSSPTTAESLNVSLFTLTPQSNPLSDQPVPPHPTLSASTNLGGIGKVTESSIPNTEPILEESFPENSNSPDWEMIEGLDGENLEENEPINRFIQLDIDTSESVPELTDSNTINSLDSQELDRLLGLENDQWPEGTPSPAEPTEIPQDAGLEASQVTPGEPLPSQSHRQEIDDLYQSLFGTEAVSGTTNLDKLDDLGDADSNTSERLTTDSDFPTPKEEPSSPFNSSILLSPGVEDFLFEGLADPTTELSQAEPVVNTGEHLPESWEMWLFKDTVTHSSLETNLAGVQPSDSNSTSDSEGVETITELTELLDQMGLTYSEPTTEASSIFTTREEEWSPEATADSDPPTNLVDDPYIPASPDEDLLATDKLTNDSDREIELDQNTLQKLSEDLHSFEEFEPPNVPTHKQLGNKEESSPIPPVQQFPLSEELLAEDWEEFALHDLSSDARPFSGPENEARTDLSTGSLDESMNDE